MFAAGESFLSSLISLISWKLQDRAQATDLELIRNFNFPHSASYSRCGKLHTLRLCIALKLQLFIGSNLFLKESQLVKEFCSKTTSFALVNFVTTSAGLWFSFCFQEKYRKSKQWQKSLILWEGISCLGNKSSVLCKPVNKQNHCLVSEVGQKKKWGKKKKGKKKSL